jgi:hypothetical protein
MKIESAVGLVTGANGASERRSRNSCCSYSALAWYRDRAQAKPDFAQTRKRVAVTGQRRNG